MKLMEVFESISGEVGTKILQGEICTFVRFYGCPVGCVYCDTKDSWQKQEYVEKDVDQILDMVENLGNEKVILTGGEPLCQKEIIPFIELLYASEFITDIVIETSGIYPKGIFLIKGEKIAYAVDYKLPSAESKYSGLNKFPFSQLTGQDIIKFLIADGKDLQIAVEICTGLMALKWKSDRPKFVFGALNNKGIPNILNILNNYQIPAIINVQIHKILNIA